MNLLAPEQVKAKLGADDPAHLTLRQGEQGGVQFRVELAAGDGPQTTVLHGAGAFRVAPGQDPEALSPPDQAVRQAFEPGQGLGRAVLDEVVVHGDEDLPHGAPLGTGEAVAVQLVEEAQVQFADAAHAPRPWP